MCLNFGVLSLCGAKSHVLIQYQLRDKRYIILKLSHDNVYKYWAVFSQLLKDILGQQTKI